MHHDRAGEVVELRAEGALIQAWMPKLPFQAMPSKNG
jgi:hypothetical protein